MRYNIGDKVKANTEISQEATEDTPAFQFCVEGQELIVKSCFPAKLYPKHGVDSYAVQDINGTYGDFFIDCDELY